MTPISGSHVGRFPTVDYGRHKSGITPLWFLSPFLTGSSLRETLHQVSGQSEVGP